MMRKRERLRVVGNWWSLVVLLGVCVSCVAASDAEPNDVLNQATALNLIDVGVVHIQDAELGNGPLGAADRDLFWFDVSAAAAKRPVLVSVRMTATVEGFDGYLRLFSPQGYDIAHNDDAGYPDLSPHLQAHIAFPGIYFIGVSHAGNSVYSPTDAAGGRAADTSGYELMIELSAGPPLADSLELEFDEAVNVTGSSLVATGQFLGDGEFGLGDVDRYAIALRGPAIITAVVTPRDVQRLTPALSVEWTNSLHSFSEVLVPAHEPSRSRDGAQRIEVAVFDTDEAQVVLQPARGWPTEPGMRSGSFGFYDISIEVELVELELDGPFEPNDSLLHVAPTGLTGVGFVQMSAVIGDGRFGSFRGDIDFFKLPMPVHQRLVVEVEPVSAGGASSLLPAVQVYDYLGETVGRAHAGENNRIEYVLEWRCEHASVNNSQGEHLGVAIMGAGSRPPIDPLSAWKIDGFASCPTCQPPLPLYAIDGGAGSTGAYDVTFSILPSEFPTCGSEPDDTITDVSESVLAGSGEYACGGTLGDSPCPLGFAGVDILRVTSMAPQSVLDVRLITDVCGAPNRVLRLFDATGLELSQVVGDGSIRHTLDAADDYFLGVSNQGAEDYDPFVACSDDGFFDEYDDVDRYELEIRLTPPEPDSPQPEAPNSESDAYAHGDDRLFATSLDPSVDAILELDVLTGDTLASIEAPEGPIGGGEGLAFDGVDLYFLGGGRFPYLYRMDADTGDVIERSLTWFGSGIYGDLVAHAGGLCVVDMRERAVYVTPTALDGPVKRLDVGMGGVGLRGPIALRVGPNRLLAIDAADPAIVHEINPDNGAILSSLALGGACACAADFDGDGDVDGEDAAVFNACNAISGVAFGCIPADLNCDQDINAADAAILDCQRAGPGVPPNSDCCPEDLPTVAGSATSLASVGGGIVTGNWLQASLRRVSFNGAPLDSIAIDKPIGALAGVATAPFGDADMDDDVDLLDWSALQTCFSGDGLPSNDSCDVFDFDSDGDVDLQDYGLFQNAFSGDGL